MWPMVARVIVAEAPKRGARKQVQGPCTEGSTHSLPFHLPEKLTGTGGLRGGLSTFLAKLRDP